MTMHYPAGSPIEIKSADDDALPELVTKALGDMQTGLNDRLAAVETKAADAGKLADRLDRLEARQNRPGTVETKAGESIERKAFATFLRHGAEALSADERKALQVSTATQAGYLAPPEVTMDIIRDLTLFSPVRQLATIKSTSAPSVTMPKRTSITNATWKAENADQNESNVTFTQLEIDVFEINTYVDVSNQLLADAAADVNAEVGQALAEDFAAKEGLAYVAGTGSGQPRGFMANTDVQTLVSGAAAAITPDALISMVYSLPAFYRGRGTFVMNGNTLAALRKLKDSTGQYLWQPALVAGQPETILGRPVVELPDMPDPTANALPIAFGDFATAYRIVERLALEVVPNPWLLRTKGMTRFHATRRVGADVVQPKALRKLKVAAS